jgi:ubiquitin-activating enzyme E1
LKTFLFSPFVLVTVSEEDFHVKRARLDARGGEAEVDESLESRSMLVYGVESMKLMKRANVLLSGASGLGAEIAKNVALAGVRSLTIHDDARACWADLGTHFYLDETSLGRNRAELTAPRVAELNAAVRVAACTQAAETLFFGDDSAAFDAMELSCVILVGAPLQLAVRVNALCRRKRVAFLLADVKGAFCWSFTDCGASFRVLDADGEEPAQLMLSFVSHDEHGCVRLVGDARHNLADGDVVRLTEIDGMPELNCTERTVKVLSPTEFAIGDTRACAKPYAGHGLATPVKQPVTLTFEPLEQQLRAPALLTADFAKLDAPRQIFFGLQALDAFAAARGGALPRVWHAEDADAVAQSAAALVPAGEPNAAAFVAAARPVWRRMAMTARGALMPLSAFLGGVVAQECLKALSGKFTPQQQWLLLDALELVPSDDELGAGADLGALFAPRDSRADALRACVGEPLVQTLATSRLFMVGVGAIGCELLKNFALLGVATAGDGLVTITDPDLIERSNLNRQFLFRNSDIGQSKAERAAAVAQSMNAALRVQANLDKVGPDTEAKYDNKFFRAQSAIVNALDNIQARLYVDQRCVTNQRALLESGTLGPKGHVQVIVPHLTESYGSQRDPPEKDVPMCTLRSFPSQLEHVVEWARDFSFGGAFVVVPESLNRLAQEKDVLARLAQPAAGGLDGRLVLKASKALARRPASFADCLQRGKQVFDRHYRCKALTLLHMYPPDMTVDKLGTLFWSAPKRAPTPIEFSFDDALHRDFVVQFAHLYARVWHIASDAALLGDAARLRALLDSTPIEPFVPKKKKISTDESISKEAAEAAAKSALPEDYDEQLKRWSATLLDALRRAPLDAARPLDVAAFEKDDDANHHVDFIAAAANLRARMYGIAEGDRLKIKSIAGRIMPAIATTTSCVSGLATLELCKVLRGDAKIERYKNAFLNLALPFVTFSEPREAEKKKISADISITLWDSWEVRDVGTLDELIAYFDAKYKLVVTGVTYGAKMIFMSFLPMHKKRRVQQMRELCGAPEPYVDLTIAFKDRSGNTVNGPAVRFWFAN